MTYSKWEHFRALLNSRLGGPMMSRNSVSLVWRDGFDTAAFAEFGAVEWDFDFILSRLPVRASLVGLTPDWSVA